jgi:hypothetical protein
MPFSTAVEATTSVFSVVVKVLVSYRAAMLLDVLVEPVTSARQRTGALTKVDRLVTGIFPVNEVVAVVWYGCPELSRHMCAKRVVPVFIPVIVTVVELTLTRRPPE